MSSAFNSIGFNYISINITELLDYEQYQQNEVTTNQIPPVQMGQSQQRQQQQPQLFQSAQMSPQSSQLFQETGMNHSQIPQAHTSQTIVEPMMVDSTESSIASSSNVNNIDLQKYDEFKRMKENSVQISNINIMENSLTPRYNLWALLIDPHKY